MTDSKEYELRFKGKNELGQPTSDAASDIGKLADALQDPAQRADAVASQLEAMFTRIDQDATRTAEVVDRFTQSLGPQLTGALERSGSSVEAMVGKFREAGLSLDDIEANTGRLGQTIGAAADVSSRHGARISGDFERMGASADRARGVVANFAGNAIQEIPGISGAMGPLNIAIGQFAEGVAEGSVRLKDMAAVAAPIAGVTLALQGVNSLLDDMNAADAFNADLVTEFAAAIREQATTAVDEFLKKVAETGRVKIGLPGFSDDFTGELDKMGLSVGEFMELTKLSDRELVNWAKANRDKAGDQTHIMEAAIAVRDALSKADREGAVQAEIAAEAERILAERIDARSAALNRQGEASREGAAATEDATQAAETEQARLDEIGRQHKQYTDSVVAGIDEQIQAQKDLEQAQRDAERAAQELFSAERARFDVQFRQEEATNQAAASVQAYGELANSGKASFLELAAAQREVQQAALSQADAVLAAAQNQADLNGVTLTGAQKQDIFRQALINFANSLPDLSPLKQQILDMAGSMNQIPTDKKVTFTADTSGLDTATKSVVGLFGIKDPGASGGFDKTVKVGADTSDADRKIAATQTAAQDLAATKVVVTPQVNVDVALARVAELRRALDAIPGAAARASASAIASATSSAAAINRIRAGSVPTSGGRVI